MPTDQTTGYLTAAIETTIAWPERDRLIEYGGKQFNFLPPTPTCTPAIRVQLNDIFPLSAAKKLLLELLSSLAWSEQCKAHVIQMSWCTGAGLRPAGNCPFDVIGSGHFDYLPEPTSEKAKIALAIYREAQSVNLVPYQFLGYFKIINVIRERGRGQTQWIRDNLASIQDKKALRRIDQIQALHTDVADYLYISGRNAVAHAWSHPIVNPDSPEDLGRLEDDLPVIRELAKLAIEQELAVQSQDEYHKQHLYELAGFRSTIGDAVLQRIVDDENVKVEEIKIPAKLSLRLRDHEPVPLFEGLQTAVQQVRDGVIYVELRNDKRLLTGIWLDLKKERLAFDGLRNITINDDGTVEGARTMLEWCRFHRGWFGGNGTIEVWDSTSNRLLGRAQPYMPPVNSLFPHEDFDRLVADLEQRASTDTVPSHQSESDAK